MCIGSKLTMSEGPCLIQVSMKRMDGCLLMYYSRRFMVVRTYSINTYTKYVLSLVSAPRTRLSRWYRLSSFCGTRRPRWGWKIRSHQGHQGHQGTKELSHFTDFTSFPFFWWRRWRGFLFFFPLFSFDKYCPLGYFLQLRWYDRSVSPHFTVETKERK